MWVKNGLPSGSDGASKQATATYLGNPLSDAFEGVYDDPREVGPDRIANAVGALERYGAPAIVVDFGSSISVSGRTPTDAVVVFPVDEKEATGATFRLDDGTHLPAEVPFDGAVPADGQAQVDPSNVLGSLSQIAGMFGGNKQG